MSHGGFSETLAYVSIPTVANEEPSRPPKPTPRPVTMNQGASVRRKEEQNPNPGRTALIDVFQKLRDQKVACILNLEVEDRRSPSHTDAAIELAIQGRDSSDLYSSLGSPIIVETW